MWWLRCTPCPSKSARSWKAFSRLCRHRPNLRLFRFGDTKLPFKLTSGDWPGSRPWESTQPLLASVDAMSSSAWISALGAMDLSQMCVQAMWETDSPLTQIPHFEAGKQIHAVEDFFTYKLWSLQVIKCCKGAGVDSVYDIMELHQ